MALESIPCISGDDLFQDSVGQYSDGLFCEWHNPEIKKLKIKIWYFMVFLIRL
jgi:hypothetical protein